MPYKDKEKAKQYQTEYNKKSPVIRKHKCELCNYQYANILETIDDKFTLCPNHLLELVMRDLTIENARLLLKTHGRTAYLDEMFYTDDGEAMQPV